MDDASANHSRFRVETPVPTYDYECKKCRHTFEEVQPFSSEPVAACPKCSANAVRQFSVPIVVYKGSGFYTTDHGRGSTGGNGSSKKNGDADSANKGERSSSGKDGDGASPAKTESASTSKNGEVGPSGKSDKKEAVKASSSSQPKS